MKIKFAFGVKIRAYRASLIMILGPSPNFPEPFRGRKISLAPDLICVIRFCLHFLYTLVLFTYVGPSVKSHEIEARIINKHCIS